MSQKLPVNGFEWVKKLSKFDEPLITGNDEDSNKGYFLEVDVEYQKIHSIYIWIFHFYHKKIK